MKAKSKADRLSVRLVHMEILLALALLGVVFLTAAHSDTVSARQQMATTIRYIREQCNRYNRIELASETKSLMRVMSKPTRSPARWRRTAKRARRFQSMRRWDMSPGWL